GAAALGADNALDADLDEVLAVAALAARIFAAAFLKGDNLRAARLFDELGNDLGAGDQRGADFRVIAADQQNLAELDLRTGFTGNLLNGDDVVSSNTILLAARLDDS